MFKKENARTGNADKKNELQGNGIHFDRTPQVQTRVFFSQANRDLAEFLVHARTAIVAHFGSMTQADENGFSLCLEGLRADITQFNPELTISNSAESHNE